MHEEQTRVRRPLQAYVPCFCAFWLLGCFPRRRETPPIPSLYKTKQVWMPAEYTIYVLGYSTASQLMLLNDGTFGAFPGASGTIPSYPVGSGGGQVSEVTVQESVNLSGARIYFFIADATALLLPSVIQIAAQALSSPLIRLMPTIRPIASSRSPRSMQIIRRPLSMFRLWTGSIPSNHLAQWRRLGGPALPDNCGYPQRRFHGLPEVHERSWGRREALSEPAVHPGRRRLVEPVLLPGADRF